MPTVTTTSLTRRGFAGLGLSAVLLLADTGCLGDTGDAAPALGLFRQMAGVAIPSQVAAVRSTGYDTAGTGSARYVHDRAVDSGYVFRHPRSAFLAADGRGFRLEAPAPLDPTLLGLRLGLDKGYGTANRAALAEAITLARRVILPAGDIDFIADGPFGLPPLDGIEIAGAGWKTHIVTRDSAFMIPTLKHLMIRDLWIEQVATAFAPIMSLHANPRDIRLLRLKITMRDQGTCQSNCISFVMDASPFGEDGVRGLDGLLIEDCWLAPGRMGVEIQNHRAVDPGRIPGYRNVTMRGCTIWKAPAFADTGMGISFTGWGADCLVEKNRFVACHGPNVELVGSDNTTVIDNVFENAIGSPVVASNVRVVRGCRILNNRTTGTPPAIGLNLVSIDGGEVAGNHLAASQCFIIKAANLHVHDNELVAHNSTSIINLDNAYRVMTEKNVLRSVGPDPAPKALVIAFNNSTECTVRFNRLERADYDLHNDAAWFLQAPPAKKCVAYGNERHSAKGVLREPNRRT